MSPRRPKPLYLAIDFGSSHIRAAVGPATGKPLAIARTPVKLIKPKDGPDTAVELDPEEAWKAICATAKRAVAESGARPDMVRAVSVTSQRLGLVMYGKDGKEIYTGPNKDLRGVFQGGQIDADAGNMLWQMTGHGPGMLTAWARLLWFREERPELFETLRTVSGLADWVAFRMTGILLMESALACEAGLGLVATGAPAEGLAFHVGLDDIDFPPTCQAGTVIGRMVGSVAKRMGLPDGLPVIAAGPDSQAGLLGMGVTQPETGGVIAGWSASVQRITHLPLFDDTHATWTGRHVVPDRWVVEGNAGEMGGAYQWLVELMCPGEDPAAAMRRLDRQAARVENGSDAIASYLGPSFTNISDISLRTGGILFPVPISFEPPDRAKLARAALEGFAFAIRYNADRLAMFGGPARWYAAGGGMTRSRTFRDVLAATLGGAVGFAPEGETSTLGALTLAASGAGDADLHELTETRRAELRVVTAAAPAKREYDELYHAWRSRERRLTDIELS